MTWRDDRGVSVAVTHILAIGITVVLIGVLFVGMGSLVDTQTDRSAESSLETIGERLAGEIASVDRQGGTVTAEHPARVSQMSYQVELLENCHQDEHEPPLIDEDTELPCLRLTASGADAEVFVPFTAESDLEESSVRGGTIDVIYDEAADEIRLAEGG